MSSGDSADDAQGSKVVTAAVVLGVLFAVVVVGLTVTTFWGMGDTLEKEARASVDVDVDENPETIEVRVTEFRDGTDYVIIRGDGLMTEVSVNGSYREAGIVLTEENRSVELSAGEFIREGGKLTFVGMIGRMKNSYYPVWGKGRSHKHSVTGTLRSFEEVNDRAVHTTIQQVEYNFSEGGG